MKKSLLLSLALTVGMSVVGQNYLYQPKPITFTQDQNVSVDAVKTLKSSFSAITPEATFVSDGVINTITNLDNREILYFKESTEFDEDKDYKSTTITFLDENFSSTGKTVTLDFPSMTNSVSIVKECNSDYFLVSLQYFVGEGGPTNRRPEMWAVGFDGTIKKKVTFIDFYSIYAGKFISIVSDDLNGTNERMEIADAKTFEVEKVLSLPTYKQTREIGSGQSIILKEIEGKSYLGFAYLDKAILNTNEMTYDINGNYLLIDYMT